MAINKGDSLEVEISSVIAGVSFKTLVTAVSIPRPSKERVDLRVQRRNRSRWTSAFDALEPSFTISDARNQLQSVRGTRVRIKMNEIITEEAFDGGADKAGWDIHQYVGILNYQPTGEFAQGDNHLYIVTFDDVTAYAMQMGTIDDTTGAVSHLTAEHWAPDAGIWFRQTADEAAAGTVATTNYLLPLWKAAGETTTPAILGNTADLPLS